MAGVDNFHRLQITYGLNGDGTLSPLDLNLSSFTGFRIRFDFNNLDLNLNIVIWSHSGSRHSGVPAPLPVNTHTGPFNVEILLEEFLKPLEISAYRLSKDTFIPQTRISEITKGQRRITADTALRLARSYW